MTDGEPLDGVTVISLAVNLPGPLAAARLKSMGARVIKVEPPQGDPLAAAVKDYYEELAADQEIVTIDLKDPSGRERFEELAADADLVITAMRPRAAAALGVPELIDRHELVHVEIVGFAGDRADIPGHDLTYQAAHATLVPGTVPTVPVADVIGGEHAALQALAGLRQKQQGVSSGIVKRVVLDDAAAWAAGPAQHGLTSPGSYLGGGSPFYRTYPTADGHIAIACVEPHFAKSLAKHIGTEQAVLERTFVTKPTAHWLEFAEANDLPIEAVRAA